jgi:tRNA (guanosine-2'-O-)-methyltransferase
MIRSLNVSVACAVSLYEAFRQRTTAGQYEKQTIDDKTYEVLKIKWTLNHGTDQ